MARPGLAVVVLAVRHVRRPAPTLKQSQNLPGRLGPQAGGRRTFSSRPRKASTPGLRAAGAPPTACSAAIATMNCWRMPSVSPRPCPATVGGTVFVALCVRTSSCAVVPDRAHRPSGRHRAHRLICRGRQVPQGTKAPHQLLHFNRPRRCPPAIRPTRRTISSAAAAQCPKAPHQLLCCRPRRRPPAIGPTWRSVSSAVAAPRCPKALHQLDLYCRPRRRPRAGHRANAAHRLGRRGRHVPQGTKQHTSSCAVVPDGAHRPSGQFELPLPNGTPRPYSV